MRVPLGDEPVSPVHVGGWLYRADCRDRSPAFGDGEAHARSDTLQMPAQMGFQFSYSDGLHM